MVGKTNLRPPTGRDKVLTGARILIREQGSVIFYGVIFLFGVAIGAVVVSWLDTSTSDSLLTILGGFVAGRQNQSIAATFASALTPNLIALGALCICGFCAISAPVILLVPCFKGMGFGLTAAVMFARYGIHAAQYLAVMELPNLIWSTIIILFGCRDAMRMSRSFWNAMAPQQRGGVLVRPGRFCARMILYMLLLAAGAAVEANLFGFFGATLALG